MFEDSTFWLFVAPGLLLGLYAQARIKANYVRGALGYGLGSGGQPSPSIERSHVRQAL